MTWQTGTTAGTSAYRDLLSSIVAVCTSKYVSAVVVNAAGTGYVVGDVLTISHAGGYHSCFLEVTTIGGGGAITAVRINSGGAFSNRAASATVSAGGTGYAVGDVLQVQGGTSTQKAKFKVATLTVTAAATVTLFETGGAYTSAPSNPASTSNDAGLGTGTGATLTLTMTGLIGTSGISATGGTGTGATFDLTLTAAGWSAVRDRNNRTENSVANEKEVVLLGTVGGGDSPYVAFTTYTQTSGLDTRYGIECFGMSAFNSSLSGLAAQPGIGPVAGVLGSSSGSHLPVFEGAREWWLSVSPRRVCGALRTTDSTVCYASFYVGLMNGFGSATTSPYPMFVGASSNTPNRVPDSSDSTGLAECFRSSSGGSGPMYFRRKSDASWVTVMNGSDVSTPTQQNANVMWPLCSVQESAIDEQVLAADGPVTLVDGKIGSNIRANATFRLYPAPDTGDDFFTLWPLTVLGTNAANNSVNLEVAGELDGVFWFSGTKADGTTVSPEDYFEDSGIRYRVFPNATQGVSAKPYQFFVIAEQ